MTKPNDRLSLKKEVRLGIYRAQTRPKFQRDVYSYGYARSLVLAGKFWHLYRIRPQKQTLNILFKASFHFESRKKIRALISRANVLPAQWERFSFSAVDFELNLTILVWNSHWMRFTRLNKLQKDYFGIWPTWGLKFSPLILFCQHITKLNRKFMAIMEDDSAITRRWELKTVT